MSKWQAQFKIIANAVRRQGQGRLPEIAFFDEAGDPLELGADPHFVTYAWAGTVHAGDIITLPGVLPAKACLRPGSLHIQATALDVAETGLESVSVLMTAYRQPGADTLDYLGSNLAVGLEDLPVVGFGSDTSFEMWVVGDTAEDITLEWDVTDPDTFGSLDPSVGVDVELSLTLTVFENPFA